MPSSKFFGHPRHPLRSLEQKRVISTTLQKNGENSDVPNAFPDRYPTFEECRNQVRHYHEMNGDVLLMLAAKGDPAACRERLVREVMFVDGVNWPTANDRVVEMDQSVQAPAVEWVAGRTIVTTSVVGGIVSIPMVFSHDTALWFNETFVTMEAPVEKDIETWLEVGAWTWNWMEPPIGTISFVILCLQLARSHGLSNPFSSYSAARRTENLQRRFPNYSPLILMQWADADLKDDLAGKRREVKDA